LRVSDTSIRDLPINEEGLHHQLSAGQMAMVAVGGSIGTGLLLGSGAAMEAAGLAAILSFLAAAFINWTVAMALGELACAHPAVPGSLDTTLYAINRADQVAGNENRSTGPYAGFVFRFIP
jgi:amino acid permease